MIFYHIHWLLSSPYRDVQSQAYTMYAMSSIDIDLRSIEYFQWNSPALIRRESVGSRDVRAPATTRRLCLRELLVAARLCNYTRRTVTAASDVSAQLYRKCLSVENVIKTSNIRTFSVWSMQLLLLLLLLLQSFGLIRIAMISIKSLFYCYQWS